MMCRRSGRLTDPIDDRWTHVQSPALMSLQMCTNFELYQEDFSQELYTKIVHFYMKM